MVYLKAWLQKKIPFFRFSSSKEGKKPFRTWIRVPGSYGQQFVIPQNDDDEVAGTADMGFEEDAGEEEVIGVEDSAADQLVEVDAEEEPTAEPGWEEQAEEVKGEEQTEEVKDEEMYDVEDWAVDGAAAYDEGEGDEKMNEGYDEDEEEERINAAGLAAFDEIVAGEMASFAEAKEEVEDDLAEAEAAQAKKAEDARVKERVERAKVIATCPPWRNKGGGGERYEKKWKGGGGGWKGSGGGNKRKGKGKGGGRKGGFVKKIEKNEKGKGKKKDEKEEDGRPRLPTPPRVPPRLPTPPRVPSSGSDGWRGDGGGRWWGKDEGGGGRKREKYEGGGGRWKEEDGEGGERWEDYGGGGDGTWKGGGKRQGGGKRGKGDGGCAGPDDDYIPCSSGGWYIKGGHGWVSPDGVYHPYLGNHSGKFSLFPPLSIYTLPFELCDRMFCMFTPGSGMLQWYIVLYVRVLMSNDFHTSGDVSWILSSLVHHVPFDHLLVFPNLLSSLVHVHAFPY